jgi:phosphotransferase system enzyme I (PtsP)
VPEGAVSLLRDVGRLLTRSHDLEETLQNVVRLVARRMRAGACSIYLLDEQGEWLVLRATRGLNPESVGRVRLRVGEGLVGACLAKGETLAVADAPKDPRFRPFPGSGEERFRSMLTVRLVVGALPVGVLVVQTTRPTRFAPAEVDLLEMIAAQVASIVLNARLLDLAFREGRLGPTVAPQETQAVPPGTQLRGISISAGIAIGPVHFQPPSPDPASLEYEPATTRRAEWRAVERALKETIRQITDLRSAVGERFGKEFAEVFTTHIIASTADPLIRERAADIEDVVRRALGELVGVRQQNPPLKDGVIVVAESIAPSEFVLLETEKIAGLVIEHGGPTSHAAIFARSLEIPAVAGIAGITRRVRPGDRVVLDGIEGGVIVNPTPDIEGDYASRRAHFVTSRDRLDEQSDLPARTLDGREIVLSANIGGLNDLELVKRHGARGVGLFRTEILALSTRSLPEEQEQVRIYQRVAEALAPDRVTIRVFDLGGDKILPGEFTPEANPQLGWRSIRVLLDRQDVFRQQLGAILRANASGNIRILLPMVTSIEELDRALDIYRAVCTDHDVSTPPPLGIMVETPAAVEIAGHLARRVDFLSIGTNDLVQYTLAMDRENERVAPYCDPLHPAVLMQIRRTSEAARAAGIPCSVCGELAGNPAATPILIGMGIDELSMTPYMVGLVRQVVRATDARRAEALAEEIVSYARGSEVRERLLHEFESLGLLDDPLISRYLRRPLESRVV